MPLDFRILLNTFIIHRKLHISINGKLDNPTPGPQSSTLPRKLPRRSLSQRGSVSSLQSNPRKTGQPSVVKKPSHDPKFEERKLFKAALDGNKQKFDVLALVSTRVLKENDKLKKTIKTNKLQLENCERDLQLSKVGLV